MDKLLVEIEAKENESNKCYHAIRALNKKTEDPPYRP